MLQKEDNQFKFMKQDRKQRLRRWISIFLGILLVLVISNVMVLLWMESALKIDKSSLELARENSSRIYKLVFYANLVVDDKENYRNDLTAEVRRFNENNKFIKEGGKLEKFLETMTLNPGDDEVLSRVKKIDNIWETFENSIKTVADEAALVDTVHVYFERMPTYNLEGFDNFKEVRTLEKKTNPVVKHAIEDIFKDTEKLHISNEDLVKYFAESYEERKEQGHVLIYLLVALSLLTIALAYLFITQNAINPLREISGVTETIARGDLSKSLRHKYDDEVGMVVRGINTLVANLEKISDFAFNIGMGNFDYPFEVRSEKDKLGFALLNMRDNLKKVSEEDKKRNWANEGISKFSEILRSNTENIESLSYSVISNMVKYLKANQGGVFLLTEPDKVTKKQFMELTAAYAYGKKKYSEKRVPMGHGLLGQAILEKATVHLTEVPENYITITSGLGEATPNTILIVPLIANETIYGAIEIAAFMAFSDYQIEFVEKLSENIASTLSTVKANQKNQSLLENSQTFTEQLRAQEEEMRQNMEELTATQEEMKRVQEEIKLKEGELTALINNTNSPIVSLDSDFNIKIFNQAFLEHFTGKGMEVFEGLSMFDLHPDHEKDEWKAHYERALAGESFAVIKGFKIAYEDYYHLLDFNPIYDKEGIVTGLSLYLKDITEFDPIRWDDIENGWFL